MTDARIDLPDVDVCSLTNAGRIDLVHERRHDSEPVWTGSVGVGLVIQHLYVRSVRQREVIFQELNKRV